MIAERAADAARMGCDVDSSYSRSLVGLWCFGAVGRVQRRLDGQRERGRDVGVDVDGIDEHGRDGVDVDDGRDDELEHGLDELDVDDGRDDELDERGRDDLGDDRRPDGGAARGL